MSIHTMKNFGEAIASMGAKVSVKEVPPAAVAGMNVAGISLPEIVQLMTIAWLAILIIDKIWSRIERWKKGKADDESV
jgi:hypothetical protein